jgi:hypothetical protein
LNNEKQAKTVEENTKRESEGRNQEKTLGENT